MKRLYIENGPMEFNEDVFGTAQRQVYIWKNIKVGADEKVFDIVIDDASNKTTDLLKAIQECDEIYTRTSFCRGGEGTIDSADLFDKLMESVISKNITNKTLYILNEYDRIMWNELDHKLLDKAFKKNYIYTLNYETGFEQVDIDELLRTKFY